MSEKNGISSLLRVSEAPHADSRDSIPVIMWLVVAALLPAAIYSVYLYGVNSLVLLLAATAAAIAAEWAFQFFMKQKVSALDGSAAITGLLVAMNLPPGAPLWVAVIGSVFAIIIVKQLFGGLGFNIFNPALAARAFLMASWPVHMTTKWHVFNDSNVFASGIRNVSGFPPQAFDVLTQATPLAALKEGPNLLKEYGVAADKIYDFLLSPEILKSLFIGNIGGVIGETSALLVLAGGIFLLVRKIITWHIPVSFVGTVAVLSLLYYSISGYQSPHLFMVFHLLSGGLFLGAFFMATDMVTSPVTNKGMLVFGAGCGMITFVIRIWGGYPEGVSYSILLMNAVVPLIDRYIKPAVFGLHNE